MVLAADYPLLEVVWTMFVFFGLVLWFSILFVVLSDVFRHPHMPGAAKAAWALLVLFVPVIGVVTYLVVHGSDIPERRVRTPHATDGRATEILNAKQLLDAGVIDQAEFSELKRKALT